MKLSNNFNIFTSGEAIVAFATVTESNTEDDDELVKELRALVRGEIGPFSAPDIICITPSLPMVGSVICSSLNKLTLPCLFSHRASQLTVIQTRSGKIMRRVLRKISCGEADQLGDISTLADPSVVDTLIDLIGKKDTALKQ
jgi:acetyl-CoA synthetase